MNVTVGGSFHTPGWNYVQETIKKIENAGHKVLAPHSEWEPIDINSNFVKFRGEEDKSAEELQKSFLESMLKSDSYVICDHNGYMGMTVCCEFGFASALLYANSKSAQQREKNRARGVKLNHIYLTDPPIGFKFWKENGEVIPNLTELIIESPEFKFEREFYLKNTNKASSLQYSDIEDFIEDIVRLNGQIFLGLERGFITVGIDELLCQFKEESKSKDPTDDFEVR